MVNLGPGLLTIGPVGSPIDVSCLINNARITVEKDQDDPRYKLCGTATPGAITYTFALSGNLDTDVADASGFFAYSQDHAGEQQPFTFTPNSSAVTSATGTLIVDPLEFGADDYGDPLDSDFEFGILGKPSYTYGASKGAAAPGDTFPAEPTVTASDATNAAKLSALGYVANPLTAWATGEQITVGTYAFHWSGTAWAAGAAA